MDLLYISKYNAKIKEYFTLNGTTVVTMTNGDGHLISAENYNLARVISNHMIFKYILLKNIKLLKTVSTTAFLT